MLHDRPAKWPMPSMRADAAAGRQAMECEIGAEAELGADVVAGVDARVAADGGEGPGSVLPAA